MLCVSLPTGAYNSHCRTPFAELPFMPKMHAICNPQHQVAYPPLENKDLMDVMRRCLDRNPKTRITLQVRQQAHSARLGTATAYHTRTWWRAIVMLAACTMYLNSACLARAGSDQLDVSSTLLLFIQELLEHPFLHPNRRQPAPAPIAAAVGLSEEQMKLLVAQVSSSTGLT